MCLIWSEPGCEIAQISAKQWGALQRKMRCPLVFMVQFYCLWVWKGRTDVRVNGSRDLEAVHNTINAFLQLRLDFE